MVSGNLLTEVGAPKVFWSSDMDVGAAEGTAATLKRVYNICRIYKTTQIIKHLSERALHKVYKVSPN